MFFPNTTTPKPTWKDSNQNSLNTQPIALDANGCAIIYGIGSYRQQVFTGPVVLGVPTGTLVWDQLTTDTSAYNSVFWAGLAAGTPNVITVVDTGFNGTDGTVINFTALATNTGSTTINPSSFGAIPVVKDTAAGPVSLSGGEIVQNNIISVVYSASGNNFHLLNTAIPSASGNSAPLCGAQTLKITNNAGTPNSLVDITATQALTQSPAGQVFNRSNVSISLNISTGSATPTAGGMDGETAGSNSWINVFLIDNGSSISALGVLASGNGLAPNMPSGYTYKCLVGAVRTDGAGNLHRLLQLGNSAQYIVSSATTTLLPVVLTGTQGTYSDTANPMTAWATATVRGTGAQPIPSIATVGNFVLTDKYGNNNRAHVAMAPNALYGGVNSVNPAPCAQVPNTSDAAQNCQFTLESDAIVAASSDTGLGIQVRGFRMGGVNAN